MTEEELQSMISDACAERNPILANLLITLAHARLSQELLAVTGASAGANFHSWAVWGSKKAGVTIRKEDLDEALRNATVVSGICGLLVGAVAAQLSLRYLFPVSVYETLSYTLTVLGASLGLCCGAAVGRYLAYSSRSKAAALVLQGNKLVLDDIGRRTAAFVLRFKGRDAESPIEDAELEAFVTDTIGENGGGAGADDELLRQAFTYYARAANEKDEEAKQQAAYFANCLAILHEHKKLQPYIKQSLPFIVSRCVTKRMLSFDIGSRQLAVSESIPSLKNLELPDTLRSLKDPALHAFLEQWGATDAGSDTSAAKDWSRIEERMSYIVDLFRYCHLDKSVFEPPYSEEQCELIVSRNVPAGPL